MKARFWGPLPHGGWVPKASFLCLQSVFPSIMFPLLCPSSPFFGSLEKSLRGIIILKKDSEWGMRRVKKIQPRAYLELALQLRGLIKSVGNDSDLHHYAKRIMCHSTHSVWAASSVWGRNPRTWRSLRPGAPQEKVPLLPVLRLILWLSEWGCGKVLMPICSSVKLGVYSAQGEQIWDGLFIASMPYFTREVCCLKKLGSFTLWWQRRWNWPEAIWRSPSKLRSMILVRLMILIMKGNYLNLLLFINCLNHFKKTLKMNLCT